MAPTVGTSRAEDAVVSSPNREPSLNEPDTVSNDGINHSDADSTADFVNEKKTAAAPLNKKQKFKRHCLRFKWWYLLAGVLLLAIILPIVFKVIIPAIIQAVVSHQGLPVHSGFFRTLSPDALEVSINTTLNSPLGIRLDPLTLTLSRNAERDDSPFTNFTLDSMHVKGLTQTLLMNQTTPITNSSELALWVADLFDGETVSLFVKGNPSVHLGALHADTHLGKTLTVPALNGLKGKTIDKLELMLDKDDEGNNIQGMLNLPNNGVLGLDFGNLTLSLFSGSLNIGNVSLINTILSPGPNPIPFKGILDLKVLLQNLGTVLSSQAQPLARGDIDLNATATSVTVNGVHIPYVEDVLKKRTLTFSINVVTLIADVLAGLLHSDRKNLGDLINEIVGNKTLIEEVNSHWNSSEVVNIGARSPIKMKRLASREALSWELLKLSMKMHRNRF